MIHCMPKLEHMCMLTHAGVSTVMVLKLWQWQAQLIWFSGVGYPKHKLLVDLDTNFNEIINDFNV
jgi:hypothetical protein